MFRLEKKCFNLHQSNLHGGGSGGEGGRGGGGIRERITFLNNIPKGLA